MIDNGTAIGCNCCGNVKLGELHPQQNLQLVDTRYGKRHKAVLEPKELLQRLAGTVEGSAVLTYVQTLFLR